MKGKVIICQRCGKEFELRGTWGKHCDECRTIANRENVKKRNQKVLRASNDTEEMRNICLNCKRGRCHGQCEELYEAFRRSKA